jgi:2-dehydro-3-deoxygalactonokinase
MADFVSCDWGTSNLRLRLCSAEPFRVLAEARGEEGAARVRERIAAEGLEPAAAFHDVLERALDDLEREAGTLPRVAPVLISGMAGSSIGWREVPYARLPFPLDGARTSWADAGGLDGGGRAFLIGGVRSDDDVMRGEETEVLGLAATAEGARLRAGGRAVLILPGTHAKHLEIAGGAVVDFTTYMTGELFALLGRHSILKHSLDARDAPEAPPAWDGDLDEDAFRAGVLHGRGRPLSGALFAVRANQLLRGMEPGANAAFLSGVLIGAEVAGALARAPAGAGILLAAGPAHFRPYTLAFAALGAGDRTAVIPPAVAETASARGHAVLWRRRFREAAA